MGAEKQQEVEVENQLFMPEVQMPQMQNDDLAEADQSHLEMELEEQEGAVGGILEERVGNAQVNI